MFFGRPGTCASPVAETATGCCVSTKSMIDRSWTARSQSTFDVVLEQAEVDAHRVVVVDVAELSAGVSSRIFCTAPV